MWAGRAVEHGYWGGTWIVEESAPLSFNCILQSFKFHKGSDELVIASQ